MIKPKGLDMARIEELFNEHFIFDKADLEKGFTRWTISPQRDDKINEVNEENEND
jgi:hypothetical protein